MLTYEQKRNLDELEESIRKKLIPCEHIDKDAAIKEIGYREEFNNITKSFDYIQMFKEVGICEICGRVYAKHFEKLR